MFHRLNLCIVCATLSLVSCPAPFMHARERGSRVHEGGWARDYIILSYFLQVVCVSVVNVLVICTLTVDMHLIFSISS